LFRYTRLSEVTSGLTVTLQLLDLTLQNEITRTDKDLDSEILIQPSALEEAAYFGGLVLAHTAWVVSNFDAGHCSA
jgi:hypothetical protein